MASGFYKKGIQAIMNKEINLDTDNIRAIFSRVGTECACLTNDEFFSALASPVGECGAATVADGGLLAATSICNAVFDATDHVFCSVTCGAALNQMHIYHHHACGACSSKLIAFIDGFSVTPNGGNITVNWCNLCNKIFRLVS